MTATIPLPADATDQGGEWGELGRPYRGTRREHGDVAVTIGGLQGEEGTITRGIFISYDGRLLGLSPADTRQVARLLMAATDEVDSLSVSGGGE